MYNNFPQDSQKSYEIREKIQPVNNETINYLSVADKLGKNI